MKKWLLKFIFLFSSCALFADVGHAPVTAAPELYENKEGKLSPSYTSANAAAMHFINLVDNQAYAGAWGDSSSLMQDIVPRNVWVAGMRSLRGDLGIVRARTVTSHQALRSLPGGTQGEFMIINFSTQFTKKPRTIESITLMVQVPFGQWKVVSYNLGKL